MSGRRVTRASTPTTPTERLLARLRSVDGALLIVVACAALALGSEPAALAALVVLVFLGLTINHAAGRIERLLGRRRVVPTATTPQRARRGRRTAEGRMLPAVRNSRSQRA